MVHHRLGRVFMLHCRKVKRQGQAQLNTRKSSSDKASLEAQSNITLKLLQCCFASFDFVSSKHHKTSRVELSGKNRCPRCASTAAAQNERLKHPPSRAMRRGNTTSPPPFSVDPLRTFKLWKKGNKYGGKTLDQEVLRQKKKIENMKRVVTLHHTRSKRGSKSAVWVYLLSTKVREGASHRLHDA